MLRGAHLVPGDLVGEVRVEVAQVAGEQFAEGGRRIDRKLGPAAVEPQRREQREESEEVVAVEVRDEDGAQLQRVDPVADELLLRPLARIDQIVLFVDVHHLGRGVAVDGRLGRRGAEYGDVETHRCAGFCGGAPVRPVA